MTTKTLTFLFLLATFCSFSQEKTTKNEFGLNLTNARSYGFHYKIGNGTSMWRFRLHSDDLSFGRQGKSITLDYDPGFTRRTTSSINLTIGIGREKRKELAPKFQLVYGFELFTSYGSFVTLDFNFRRNQTTSSAIGLAGILGARYDINDKFFIGAEILPSVSYFNSTGYFSNSTNSVVRSNTYFTDEGFDVNFNTSSAMLTVGLKF